MWGLILVDAVAGQPMLRFGLLPSYLLGGVRYYGVGNEYMAVLIGTLLCCTFLVRPPRWLAAVVFVAAAAVLGHPRLGANAGGLVAASVAFGTAYTTLRGRRATWSGFVLWSALGFACALGLAWLDAAALGGAPSHIGSALRAAHSEGAGALWEIIARKADMNARTAAIPGNVLAVAVCGLVAWLLWRGPFRARTEALAAREPWVAAAVRPVAFGSLAALLYNDTGIDAAILISGLYLVSIVFLLLAQSALPIRTLARPGDGGTGRRPATGSTGATGTPPPEGQTSC
jgi:hypothetical protein